MDKTLPLINAIVSGSVVVYCIWAQYMISTSPVDHMFLGFALVPLWIILLSNLLLFSVSVFQYRKIAKEVPFADEDTIYIATGCIWFPLAVILFFLFA
jgi:hypothetical protein